MDPEMSDLEIPQAPNCISLEVIESWKLALAELAEQAPNDLIRDCIRSYDPEKPTETNVKALNTCLKNTVTETLKFLTNDTNAADSLKYKDEIIRKLCMKIKTFYPETCQICNETYIIKLNHQPLMHCVSCGQEVHRNCYLELLKSMNLVDENEQMRHLFFNIPGICYLCQTCQVNSINFPRDKPNSIDDKNDSSLSPEVTPSSTTPNIIEFQNKKVKPPLPFTPKVIINGEDAAQDHLGRTEFMRNKRQKDLQNEATLISEDTSDKPLESDLTSTQNSTTSNSAICNFYKKGKCKHGIKGKNCHYNHPKACTKLMRYGNKQPKGCNAGSTCTDFHPRMCSSSIKFGKCFNDTCPYVHVKGTKRKPPITDNSSNHESVFLKILDNFRLEMISIINEKLKQAPHHQIHQTDRQTFLPKIPSQAIPQQQFHPRNLILDQGNVTNPQFQRIR